jgi:hypothetical protein
LPATASWAKPERAEDYIGVSAGAVVDGRDVLGATGGASEVKGPPGLMQKLANEVNVDVPIDVYEDAVPDQNGPMFEVSCPKY